MEIGKSSPNDSVGRATRYFKYAIGEIILVVIGILIALSINNWNEGRKDRLEEQKILRQLKNEYEKNLAQLDEKIYMRNQMTHASNSLLKFIDKEQVFPDDSLTYYMFRLTQEPTFDPIKNDLVVSGKLRMIQNDSLTAMLSNWTTEVYQVQEIEVSWQNIRYDYVLPIFMNKNFARNGVSFLLKNGYTPDHALDKTVSLTYDIKKTDVDIAALVDNNAQDIQNVASTCILYNKLINGASYTLRNRIEKILELIDSEIKD